MKKIQFTEKSVVLTAFVAIETVLYVIFNTLSILQPAETPETVALKYIGILLSLICAVYLLIRHYRNKDCVLVIVALVFTAISDLFILVLDDYFNTNSLFPLQYNIGLATFLVTHCIYFYRLYADRIKKIWISLSVRLALIVILLGVMCGLFGFNPLLVEACIYIVILGGNVVDGFIICRRSPKNLLFAIGLLCFFFCDLFVGLQNAHIIGLNLRHIYRIVTNFIWIFYLPAQVLFVLSIGKYGMSGNLEKL